MNRYLSTWGARAGLLLVLGCMPSWLWASTTCNRGSVTMIHTYSQPPGSDSLSIWIEFSDGGSAVSINTTTQSKGFVEQAYTALNTALQTGTRVLIRYDETGLTCPPPGPWRNDIQGFQLRPIPTSGADEIDFNWPPENPPQ